MSLVKGVPREQYERERDEARGRHSAERERARQHQESKRVTTVTWLPEPVRLGGSVMVVGVSSDAAPEVRAAYL